MGRGLAAANKRIEIRKESAATNSCQTTVKYVVEYYGNITD
jgi:hypothetical protein